MRLLVLFVFFSGVAFGQFIPKQLNCNEVEGIESCELDAFKVIPKKYSGIVKCCENNKVTSIKRFKNGLRVGLSQSWYDGYFIAESYFIDDYLQWTKSWDWNTQKLTEFENYKNRLKHGLNYRLDGEKWDVWEYRDGVKIDHQCYDKSGAQVEDCKDW